jgi:hypothetical protein
MKNENVGLWRVLDELENDVTSRFALKFKDELVLPISFEKLSINNVNVDGDELSFLNFHIFDKEAKKWVCISTLGTGRLKFFAESGAKKLLIGINANKKEYKKNKTFWDFTVVEYKGNKLNGEYEECSTLLNTADDSDIDFDVDDELLNIDF